MRYFLITAVIILGGLVKSAIADAYTIPNIINKDKDPDLYCMAQNIFFEAGTESYMGKVAVALVTMNRVNDARYPNSICEVVYQGPVR